MSEGKSCGCGCGGPERNKAGLDKANLDQLFCGCPEGGSSPDGPADAPPEGAKAIVVALAGNPNSGKTSLFNKLTGLRARVGNWPGVTVEKKWGRLLHRGRVIELVDLPGIYSLNSYSLDEKIARDFILNEKPDLVVDVLDSTNLERNLYLGLQFLELGLPTVLALNMMDMAEASGLKIDAGRLEAALAARAAPIVARTGAGLEKLLDKIVETAERPDKTWRPLEISYGLDVDEALETARASFRAAGGTGFPDRWLALKFLEGDAQIEELLERETPGLTAVLAPGRERLAAHIKTTLDDDVASALADRRYGFLAGLIRTAVQRRGRRDARRLTDALDKILLNRLLAPLFFLAAIYGLYQFTFWASAPAVGLLEAFFGRLSALADSALGEGLLKSLIQDGLLGGVAAVLGFTPLIAFMFIGISILEDSGYMARAAFILDRLFRAFGLHGNSALALIVGGGIAGGCAIPGVMAARTLREPRERIATILVTPMMTCGAKLPVFLLLTGAFFADRQALVMLGLTVFAWAAALLTAKILRIFILPGEPAPFVMELPPYRLPTVSGVLLHAWERTWGYIKRAGTIIVVVTVIMWLMMSFPGPSEERAAELEARLAAAATETGRAAVEAEIGSVALKSSLAGRLGLALEPLSRLAGFEWRTNVALIGGFAAKEVVLSTLAVSYALSSSDEAGAAEEKTENEARRETVAAEADGAEALQAAPAEETAAQVEEEQAEEEDEEASLIRNLGPLLAKDPAWSPLAAVSLMLFVLIYAPCFATIAVIYKEIGRKWAAFSLTANTVCAYLFCVAVYQAGLALGL